MANEIVEIVRIKLCCRECHESQELITHKTTCFEDSVDTLFDKMTYQIKNRW